MVASARPRRARAVLVSSLECSDAGFCSLTAAVAWGFAVLALVCFLVPALASWLDRRRRALPELTALCMAIESRRQVKLELRIRRPASAQDWAVRKVEWLEPAGVRIASQAGEFHAGPMLETNLRPRDARGCWFDGDASLWALYPRQSQPAHHVRLRVTLQRPGERPRKLVLTSAFPAMDWTAAPTAPPRHAPATEMSLSEARPWQARDWDGPGAPGLA